MVKKALILTWDGFQDQEVIYPYYRVQEEGFTVDMLGGGKVGDKITGLFGIKFDQTIEKYHLVDYDTGSSGAGPQYHDDNWDLLIIPGGVKALEKLRQEHDILNFISEWDRRGKIIASTCHGAQMLISAKVVRGRKISGYYSIQDDINNAGAEYWDAPAVVDKNIISSPHYKHMGEWMKVTLQEYHRLYGAGGIKE